MTVSSGRLARPSKSVEPIFWRPARKWVPHFLAQAAGWGPPPTHMASCTGGRPDDWRTATGGGAAGWRLPARDRRQKPGSTFSMLQPTTTRTLNTTCIAPHFTQLDERVVVRKDEGRKPNASCTREKGRSSSLMECNVVPALPSWCGI